SLDEGEGEESGVQLNRMTVALKALAESGTCARETLERFVTFSPFENIDELLAVVKDARTAVEIKRDSALLELPERLHKNEGRLQILETKLAASQSTMDSMRAELSEIGRALPDVRNLSK